MKTNDLQGGLSLIELMVSLTLGLFIIATIGYVYIGGSRTFRMLEANSRLQENARYAIERISFDLRMAGYTGCASTTYTNVLKNTSSWQFNLLGKPLIGYEESVSTFPTLSGRLRGDALTIVRADNASEYIIEEHQPSSANMQLTSNHDLQKGDTLLVTDCTHTAMFQMTNANNNANTKAVDHGIGQSVSPGNYTKGFGIPSTGKNPVFIPASECATDSSKSFCNDTNGEAYTFAEGSRIYRVFASTYYIGRNPANEPALYRMKLGTASGNSAVVAEEIVEGVENMQITYGIDTTTEVDNAVDTYLAANQVETAVTGLSAEDAWKRVLSVRMSLLMVTRDGEQTTDPVQKVTFNGQEANPNNDHKLRKIFTTTIAVRNRL